MEKQNSVPTRNFCEFDINSSTVNWKDQEAKPANTWKFYLRHLLIYDNWIEKVYLSAVGKEVTCVFSDMI